MKVRNYEKKELIIFLILITITMELLLIFYLFIHKKYEYTKLSGIVIKDNIVLVITSKKERNLIYKNAVLYYNDKSRKYQVVEDHGKVLNSGHYELVLKFKFSKKQKVNDVLELSFKQKKIKLIELFKIIWEGD